MNQQTPFKHIQYTIYNVLKLIKWLALKVLLLTASQLQRELQPISKF